MSCSIRQILIASIGLATTSPALAQVFRCTTPDGRMAVQDTPCAKKPDRSVIATGGLDLLSESHCVYWARTVSPATDLNQCLMSFIGSRSSYTIDFVQVSIGGKVTTLQLFDSNVQDREISPGNSVAVAERLSFTSPDKAVQVYLSAALIPMRQAGSDDHPYEAQDRLKYRGTMLVKTPAGEKNVDIAYERPSGGGHSGYGRSARKGR